MRRPWTAEQVDELRALYGAGATMPLSGGLLKFSERHGRHPANVVRKARSLGLAVNQRRRKVLERKPTRKTGSAEELRDLQSKIVRARLAERGHPRGFLGKKHSERVRADQSALAKRTWGAMTDAKLVERNVRQQKTRLANGTVNERPNASWKAAWREIGGIRKYYRSRWEANYARYLEWLKTLGKVASWKHEPDVFWFNGVKRGCVSYLPDFRVEWTDGRVEYHEVKGWMDPKSRTKLKRMRKYHPTVKMVVIDGTAYRRLASSMGGVVHGWE